MNRRWKQIRNLAFGLTAALSLVSGLPTSATAEAVLPKVLQDVGFDQRLDAQVPLDLTFNDEQGNTVPLRKYIHDKPVILVLAYYQCPRLCNVVLNALVQGLLEISFDAGREFDVVVVSFDPRETPDVARSKKQSYLARYGRSGADGGWHFLTGKEESIAPLARSVGFRYRFDPATQQFAHASGLVLLTPSGRVSRYFYDVRYSGRDLRLGLVEASNNKIGTPVDQFLLFCFHYDVTAGKYSARIMVIVRLLGVATIFGIGLFVVWLNRTAQRRTGGASQPPSAARPSELPPALEAAAATAALAAGASLHRPGDSPC
jgi:protein SCO1/2